MMQQCDTRQPHETAPRRGSREGRVVAGVMRGLMAAVAIGVLAGCRPGPPPAMVPEAGSVAPPEKDDAPRPPPLRKPPP
jgi:hypothetical protein